MNKTNILLKPGQRWAQPQYGAHILRSESGTFGLDGERHVVSGIVSPPEEAELFVSVDLLVSGLVLQGLSVT